jgi:dolichol-phosphate mannosyltransferase
MNDSPASRSPSRSPSASRDGVVTLELIIPVFNEAEVLGMLLERIEAVLSPRALAERGVSALRVTFVDDGSTDASAEILARHIADGLDARLIRFSRNFGHQSAVCAGLDRAAGDLVVVMDADLQDPPEVVLSMIDRWRCGADVVFARRRRRKGNPLKRAGYWAFYRMVAFLSEIRVPLDAGDFSLLDRRVVMVLRALPEQLRFPRGLRAWVGFRQEGVEFDRPERCAGKPKYAWRQLYRLATDGIASMSTRPLQVAQLCTFAFGLLTMALLVVMLAGYAASPLAIPRPFLLAYVLVASGNAVQSLCLYILGAYVGRTYLEVKGRPPYLVMEVVEKPG